MPILAAVPAAAAVGGGTAAAGGTAVLGGLTATQVAAVAVYSTALVVTGVVALDVISDALDTPVTTSEAETIVARAGEVSKAERDRLRGCATCIWCQINIQAQGTLIYGAGARPARQGIGPYLRERTIFAREGIIITGITHEFVRDVAPGRGFSQIETWAILARTVAFIQKRVANGGLPPGEYRAPAPSSQNSQARYDINVLGTINAFLS